MSTAPQLLAIAVRREEIKSLARQYDMNQAVKRLMDYARDFSNDRVHQNAAVAISFNYNRTRDKERRGTESAEAVDTLYAKLLERMLWLTDEIYECSVPGQRLSGKTKRDSPLRLVLEPSDEDAEALRELKELDIQPSGEKEKKQPDIVTSFEDARLRFKKRWSKSEVDDADRVAFRCQNLSKRYGRNQQPLVLSDISIELRPGEITGVVGVNGVGKTTLLRIIAGELQRTGGDISYALLSPGRLDWQAIRHQIGYVEQLPRRWYGPLRDNLHFHAASHGVKGRENEAEVDFIIQRLGLDAYRDSTWTEISGGYKTRFELAKALVGGPSLLILDEPLAPLDVISQQVFLRDLRDLANSALHPLPIILSSQHLYEIESIADQLLFLDEGKPLFYGPPADVGADRLLNMFEVSAELTLQELMEHLHGLKGLHVEQVGMSFIVQVARSVSADAVLGRIFDGKHAVKYFRDISQSTRMLFETIRGRR